jgi:hypothetical protein
MTEKMKNSDENTKKPEWLSFCICYMLFYIGSNFIITEKANWIVSPLISGNYFDVIGKKAIIYGIVFSSVSIIMFIYFILSFLKYIKLKNISKNKIFKMNLLWISFYIYLPLYNLNVNSSTKVIQIMVFILLLLGMFFVPYRTYKFYKEIRDI